MNFIREKKKLTVYLLGGTNIIFIIDESLLNKFESNYNSKDIDSNYVFSICTTEKQISFKEKQISFYEVEDEK